MLNEKKSQTNIFLNVVTSLGVHLPDTQLMRKKKGGGGAWECIFPQVVTPPWQPLLRQLMFHAVAPSYTLIASCISSIINFAIITVSALFLPLSISITVAKITLLTIITLTYSLVSSSTITTITVIPTAATFA